MSHILHRPDERAQIDDFFAAVRPESLKDGSHLREITAARIAVDDAKQRLQSAVEAARDAGDSWSAIGVMLGMSKQNAYRKFGRKPAESTPD